MSSLYEVTCIRKPDRHDPHSHITHIGGIHESGKVWTLGQKAAIKAIKSGEMRFYVSVGDKPVEIIVAESRYGHKYLKTVADGDLPNNLLRLPQCPEAGRPLSGS